MTSSDVYSKGPPLHYQALYFTCRETEINSLSQIRLFRPAQITGLFTERGNLPCFRHYIIRDVSQVASCLCSDGLDFLCIGTTIDFFHKRDSALGERQIK